MSIFRRGFAVLALGNLLGKVGALAREIVFAGAFGVGPVASGFRVAQTASIVPSNLVAGDLLSAAFAPSYALESKNDPKSAAAQLWGYASWLTGALFFVAVVVFASRDLLVQWIVPGADTAVQRIAADFLAALSWTIPLYGLSAVLAYALGAHGRYAATSMRPLIQSAGLLLGTLLAIVTGWIPWLSLGFLLAWLVYTALNLWLVVRAGLLPRTTLREVVEGRRFVRHGARIVAPLFVLAIALQISIVLERVFASLGEPGLIAAVDYARTISESVMSLIAVPLGILGLTQLSALTGDRYRSTVSKMSGVVVASMLPISSVLAVAAVPIVTALYARGEFGEDATLLTSSVLVGLSVGLAFQVLGYALSRALTAVGRNNAVLKFTLIALLGQVVVQGVGVSTIGAFAIGLGPSIFGLFLSVGCAFALGVLRGIAYQCLCSLPAIIVTVSVILLRPGDAVGMAIVLASWSINLIAVPALRRPIFEQLVPIRDAVRARFRRKKDGS